MRRAFAAALALALSALALKAWAAGQPLLINYQGKLLDKTTKAPKNGSFNMTFKVYDAASGGTQLFSEGPVAVTVDNGVFNYLIGTSVSLSSDAFVGGSAYLGLTVAPDAEMTPRQRLVAAPYAYSAAQLVNGSEIRVAADNAYSTFTAAGDLLVPKGLVASTGVFTGVTASSLSVPGNFYSYSGALVANASMTVYNAASFGPAAKMSTFTAAGDLDLHSAAALLIPATFYVSNNSIVSKASVTVYNAASFGPAAKLSTFTAGGDLTLHTAAALTVPATFYISNNSVVSNASFTVYNASQFGTGVDVTTITADGDIHMDTAGELTIPATFYVSNNSVVSKASVTVYNLAQFGPAASLSTFSATISGTVPSLSVSSGVTVSTGIVLVKGGTGVDIDSPGRLYVGMSISSFSVSATTITIACQTQDAANGPVLTAVSGGCWTKTTARTVTGTFPSANTTSTLNANPAYITPGGVATSWTCHFSAAAIGNTAFVICARIAN